MTNTIQTQNFKLFSILHCTVSEEDEIFRSSSISWLCNLKAKLLSPLPNEPVFFPGRILV